MNYYKDQLEDGNKYEQYVVNELKKKGIEITLTTSFKDQIEIGETLEGYEIKFDKKYEETGNIWIETEERTDVNNEWVNSGINRDDNTIFYVIGNYDVIFIFKKKILKELVNRNEIRENNMKTSKGYLLSTSEAYHYCKNVFEKNNDGNVCLSEFM